MPRSKRYDEKLDQMVSCMLTATNRRRLEIAAKHADLTLSEYMRRVIDDAIAYVMLPTDKQLQLGLEDE